jgi:hypothetical protein
MTITPLLALGQAAGAPRVDNRAAQASRGSGRAGEARAIIVGFGRVGRLVATC